MHEFVDNLKNKYFTEVGEESKIIGWSSQLVPRLCIKNPIF